MIDEKEIDPGFVYHPDESESVFYSAVEGSLDDDKAAALKTASDNFTAYKTRTEVRKAHEKLYAFSSWLMRNKNALSHSAIKENSAGVAKLTSANEYKVWDNLIYQTINRTSVYVREACIQLLIANKFLKAFNDTSFPKVDPYTFSEEELKAFTRRANASVVISKVLFTATDDSKPQKSTRSKTFERDIDIFTAEHNIAQYQNLTNELKKVEQHYIKDVQTAFEQALNKHNDDVERIVGETKPTIIEEKDALGNIKQIKTYPDLKVPEFTFKQEIALDEKYLKGKISEESLSVLKEQNLDSHTDFADIYSSVDEKLKSEYETVYEARQKLRTKKVSIRGAKINLTDNQINPYCFKAVHKRAANGDFGLFMKMRTDYPNASIIDATFQIQYVQNGTVKNGISVQTMSSTNNTVIAFFKFDPILMGVGTQFVFSGEFTMDNGQTYTFNTTSTVTARFSLIFNGCATLKDQGTGNGGTTPNPIVTMPVYGVTNLGIADFRRVEQEVCCYVPGEVSHIENILAREYKERET
ncbi:MAG: hypothetical protein HRT68_06100 [Flavobacteriaceae bacterium]|nr:hypothetical protein [Flavobacteriaceae bacterium]